MNQSQRIQKLLSYLQERQTLSVEEACALLEVSPATIRRDFNLLTSEGKADKTWGGIASKQFSEGPQRSLGFRKSHYLEEKKAIAAVAASFVSEGDVVMIDGGTTTLEMASLLAHKKIRIITNSLLIANQIQHEQNGWQGAELFLTGGFLYPDSGLLVGPEANKNILQYHADWAFISTGGIDAQGITNSNQLVVETERNMIGQSKKSVVLADYTKFGIRSMCKTCDFALIHTIITNPNADRTVLEAAKEEGVQIMLAG